MRRQVFCVFTHNCPQLKAPCVKRNGTQSLHYMAPNACGGHSPNPLKMQRTRCLLSLCTSLEILHDAVLLGYVLHGCLESHPSWLFSPSLYEATTLLYFNFRGDKNLHLGEKVFIRRQNVQRGRWDIPPCKESSSGFDRKQSKGTGKFLKLTRLTRPILQAQITVKTL